MRARRDSLPRSLQVDVEVCQRHFDALGGFIQRRQLDGGGVINDMENNAQIADQNLITIQQQAPFVGGQLDSIDISTIGRIQIGDINLTIFTYQAEVVA